MENAEGSGAHGATCTWSSEAQGAHEGRGISSGSDRPSPSFLQDTWVAMPGRQQNSASSSGCLEILAALLKEKLFVEPERIGRGILKPSKSIEECQAHFIIFLFKKDMTFHLLPPFPSDP